MKTPPARNFGEISTIVPDTSALKIVSIRGVTIPWLSIEILIFSFLSDIEETIGDFLSVIFLSGVGFI